MQVPFEGLGHSRVFAAAAAVPDAIRAFVGDIVARDPPAPRRWKTMI